MIRPVLGGCWGEARCACLRTQGAFQWHGYPDPVSVETCSCAQTYSHVVISACVRSSCLNLQCGASAFRGRNAVCRRSLPCVGRVNKGSTQQSYSGQSICLRSPFETRSAKEAKETDGLWWKSPRLSFKMKKGLQCGLSGSRVACLATSCRGAERGTASIGNERCAAGKSNPYLSRKIYFFHCRRLSS